MRAVENVDGDRNARIYLAGMVRICVAGLALTWLGSSVVAQDRPVAIEVEKVSNQRVIEEATSVGTLLSAESVDISPEIAGRIAKIDFDEGMPVKQGTLLFQLDSSAFDAQLKEAQSAYQLKQRNFERADGLLKNKVGTVRTRDEALSEMQVRHALLTMAQVRLEKTRMVAPFDGIIGLRNVSVGEYVQPGDKLVNLEKIDPIKVDFSIAERYLPHVHTGAQVRIRVDALGDSEFTGTLYAINPQIDPAGRSIALRATVPNPDGILRPGLFVRVGLNTAVREDAIIISEDAIVSQSGGNFVYRIIDDTAMLTPIKIGQRRYGTVEIIDGLTKDDTVVVAGQIKLRDGTKVAPKLRETPDTPAPAGPTAS